MKFTLHEWELILAGLTTGVVIGLWLVYVVYQTMRRKLKATGRVFYAVKSGSWSDPDVWGGNEVPQEGDTLAGFRSGARVVIDGWFLEREVRHPMCGCREES